MTLKTGQLQLDKISTHALLLIVQLMKATNFSIKDKINLYANNLSIIKIFLSIGKLDLLLYF